MTQRLLDRGFKPQELDEDGNLFHQKEKDRGIRLNAKAKEKIKITLYNKKEIPLVSSVF